MADRIEYEFVKLKMGAKDPFRGTGQGDETVTLAAYDQGAAAVGAQKQIRRIEREGSTITVTALDGPHKGLAVQFPWESVRWARLMAAKPAQTAQQPQRGGK